MHHAHHKATMSAEREETYVPQSRTYYGLPNESSATFSEYRDIFEETPIYTLIRIAWFSCNFLAGNIITLILSHKCSALT